MDTLFFVFAAVSGDEMLLKKLKRNKNKQNISSGKYGQVKLRHAKRGVGSCLFAIGVFIALSSFLGVAYTTYGGASTWIGSLGMIALLFAITGTFLGVRGFREREKNYITCRIGIVANGIVVLIYVILFVRGFF